jgi:polyisoprenyl-phosphate glycosyltransferase
MTSKLSSLSVIIVVHEDLIDPPVLNELVDALALQVTDFEIIIIANGVRNELTLLLKQFVEISPDTTIIFLGERVHEDVARLVGIDHAVGDYVLFCNADTTDAQAVPSLISPLSKGYDLVFGDPRGQIVIEESMLTRLLTKLCYWVYENAIGLKLSRYPTGLRIFSRSAALFVASCHDAEFRIRGESIGGGFAATSVPVSLGKVQVLQRQPLHLMWSKGIRLLLSVTTLPLRTASYLSLAGGIVSVLYSVYVVIIYLFKPNVGAGWTTTSLQLAGMMFLFSLVFLFLCEYVIEIYQANPPRGRRRLVTRELRSPLSRRSARLNVLGLSGQYQIGAPYDLIDTPKRRGKS